MKCHCLHLSEMFTFTTLLNKVISLLHFLRAARPLLSFLVFEGFSLMNCSKHFEPYKKSALFNHCLLVVVIECTYWMILVKCWRIQLYKMFNDCFVEIYYVYSRYLVSIIKCLLSNAISSIHMSVLLYASIFGHCLVKRI